MSLWRRLVARLRTVGDLVGFFVRQNRLFFVPMLLVLLAAGVLLMLTGGLSYVAPFVYTLF